MDQLERAGEPNHRLARPFASQPESQKQFLLIRKNPLRFYSGDFFVKFLFGFRHSDFGFSLGYFISCKVTLASFSSSL